MDDLLPLSLAWLAGVGLGAFFFIGLWWTVRRGLSSRQPALWFFGSLLLRTATLFIGLYFVAGGHWERLVACLVGFVTARIVVTRLALSPKEARHES